MSFRYSPFPSSARNSGRVGHSPLRVGPGPERASSQIPTLISPDDTPESIANWVTMMSKKQAVTHALMHWIAPVAVLLAGGWFIYGMGARERPKKKKAPIQKTVPVQVVQAKPYQGQLNITTNGVAVPYREVELSTRVGGEVILKSDALSPGRIVQQGELLLRIDPTDYQIEVDRLKQAVAQSGMERERLKIDKQNAERLLQISRDMVELRKRDLNRLQRLKQQQAMSPAEYDAAELAYLTASQQATAQENQIRGFETQAKLLEMAERSASLQLDKAELDLQRTEIFAPFTGVVIKNLIEQNSTVSPGTRIATIEDTSKVEVRCNIRSSDLPFLRSVDGWQGSAYELPAIPASKLDSYTPGKAS